MKNQRHPEEKTAVAAAGGAAARVAPVMFPPPFYPRRAAFRQTLLAVLLAFGLAGTASAALQATATMTVRDADEPTVHYIIVLQNTGTTNVGTFWYSWVPGQNFVPDSPTDIHQPNGWAARVTHDFAADGYGIQFTTASAPLAPGGSLTFSFESTTKPAVMAGNAPSSPSHPVGTSFVYGGAPFSDAGFQFVVDFQVPTFFDDEDALDDNVHYLQMPDGNPFGYYSYLSDSHYIYHFDLGYEYVFEANDDRSGVYLYDFTSGSFLYTSPGFAFPYLYDFSLNSVVYYYPDPDHPGRYNTNGKRFFYVFNTGQILSK